MASVTRYPRSRFYVAVFLDANGRQRRRTTRETDKKRALVMAQQFERMAKGAGSVDRIRKTMNELLRERFKEELPFSTVRDYCAQWLAVRTDRSPSTQRCYRDAVHKFLAFLGPAADGGLDAITKTQISAFRHAQWSTSAPATINLCLKVVRSIFKLARQEDYIFQDPAEPVTNVKNRPSVERRPFTLDEIQALLAVVDAEWKSLIRFGLYSGQRLGDIALLTWDKIDLERESVRMFIRKTGKYMTIPISAHLREHLLEIPAGDDAKAFVHPRAAAVIVANQGKVVTLSNEFGRYLVKIGLREHQPHVSRGIGRCGRRTGSEVSFHSLRHTAVSLMKAAGIPDSVVMELVGHESVAVSQHYTHTGQEALAKAANALPKI
jgi:Site-specific recombinase XerD